MAKSLRCKPSEVVQVSDRFEAYAFDSAVSMWGLAFDAAVEEAGRSAKTPAEAERRIGQVVRRWIPSQRRYASLNR